MHVYGRFGLCRYADAVRFRTGSHVQLEISTAVRLRRIYSLPFALGEATLGYVAGRKIYVGRNCQNGFEYLFGNIDVDGGNFVCLFGYVDLNRRSLLFGNVHRDRR